MSNYPYSRLMLQHALNYNDKNYPHKNPQKVKKSLGKVLEYAPLHKSHRLAKARFKGASVVMLSVGLCQSRKDPYLPLEPLCIRLLPRPNGLASSRFRSLFVKGCALPKNRPPPPRSRELTDASASVTTSPSCPARRVCSWVCMQCAASSSYRLQICY